MSLILDYNKIKWWRPEGQKSYRDKFFDKIKGLPKEKQDAILSQLSPFEQNELTTRWEYIARPNQLPPPDPWSYWLILAGRGWGKGTHIDTLIPTPSGFKTMAEIQVGDIIYDMLGKETTVTYTSPVWFGKKCYKVTFDDGASVIVDDDHLWHLRTKSERKAIERTDRLSDFIPEYENVFGMEYIVNNIYNGEEANFSVDNTAINGKEEVLPIEPYLLGVWLGDGTSRDGTITQGQNDVDELIDILYKKGIETKRRNTRNHNAELFTVVGLGKLLKEQGLLNNKHIPKIYLRASKNQRMELLRGLMDTDGTCSSTSRRIEFCSVLPQLANDVYELICSLGIKASINKYKSFLKGKQVKDKYRIKFSTTYDIFRLKRKLARINKTPNQVLRINRRYIKSVTEVESVPTKCIKVDSPTSTFLVTDSFIATHNTRTASEWLARECWADKNAGRYGIFGRSLNDIKRNQILGDSGLVETFKRMGIKAAFDRKDLTLTLVNGVQIYCFSSDTPDAVRGNNLSGAWFDELASYYNLRDTWDQAVLALRKGGSKAIITTTPKIVAGQLLVELMMDEDCYVTEGSSFENSQNLTKKYMKHLKKNANTRLGQQEIYAKILDDSGVLFKENWIQRGIILPENCEKIVVAVDPAMSNSGNSNEHGIIVAGKNGERGYVFADLSCVGTANHAANVAIDAFRSYNADYIVVEKNQGGMWLESVFKSIAQNIPVKLVTASRGKLTRAEPVAALYEQQKIFHCKEFVLLETQMRTFDPEGEAFKKGTNKSPDRLDALVWAFTALYEEKSFKPFIINSPVGIF